MGDALYSVDKGELPSVSLSLNIQDASLKAYQHAADLPEENASSMRTYLRLGYLYLDSQDFDLAKDVFAQCCRLRVSAEAWTGLGIACYYLNELEAAEDALAEANFYDQTQAEVRLEHALSKLNQHAVGVGLSLLDCNTHGTAAGSAAVLQIHAATDCHNEQQTRRRRTGADDRGLLQTVLVTHCVSSAVVAGDGRGRLRRPRSAVAMQHIQRLPYQTLHSGCHVVTCRCTAADM